MEREEGLRQAEAEENAEIEIVGTELQPEQEATIAETSKKRSLLIQQLRLKLKKITAERTRSRSGRKRERSPETISADDGGDGMDRDGGNTQQPSKKQCLSRSLSRSRSTEVVPGEGFRDSAQKSKAIKLAKKSLKKRNKEARRGEADRVIPNLKPKHLYSGKRSNGKTQRR